ARSLFVSSALCSSSLFSSPNATSPPSISTLSLHDALPICAALFLKRRLERSHLVERRRERLLIVHDRCRSFLPRHFDDGDLFLRSEEHTSELQSPYDLVCRLLLEKKKKKHRYRYNTTHNTS